MKKTINLEDFVNEFRAIRPQNFSYEGLEKIFDYLEEANSDMELDVIAICCDFSQCSLDEFLQAFPMIEFEDIHDDDTPKQNAIADYIEKNGFWFAFVHGANEVVFENF